MTSITRRARRFWRPASTAQGRSARSRAAQRLVMQVPKGWTVNEIPSTPDPSNAVHERHLSFVPRLATPPPRSRRYSPPYPCSRRPTAV
ncbi:hypothetical protein PVAP13_3KG065154 [Panicum virgatum]|uniref:Uncharacterized protein n=1 Tax=Panicum virgatum TaxID=38727 RepID=A0A8T0URI6_PANVG|nr:hypothetical protein PVAP13_3KG065154 [Panicum virgatum]